MVRAVGQHVERLALVQGAGADSLRQALQAEMLILLVQAGDLGLDDLVGLGVQRAAGVPFFL